MMRSRLLLVVGALGLLLGACSSGGPGGSGSGGSTATGGASPGTGGVSSGGASTGGVLNTGGTSTGGTLGSGGGSGGLAASGGSGGSATGGSASGGAGTGGGAGGPLPLGNPPVLSAGCGQPTTVTTGKHEIESSGDIREYIIDIPDNYDPETPHLVFYTSHWINSTAEAVRDGNYYDLKPLAEEAGKPAIFVAPQSDDGTWDQIDHPLFDDLLAYVKDNLCIDETRVFATGFSFGGMITYSLSTNHQTDIRAAVGIAPANYNIWLPEKTHEPIAWMQTTGMSDGTCPWVNNGSATQGAKYIAIEHATDNGCTVPADIPTWQNGAHVCYDFEGCPPEFPTKACTFGGGHDGENSDPGSSDNWIAEESWDFFAQF